MTERPRRMGVSEPHSLVRQAINIRRGNLRLWIVTTRVTVAHVVREYDQDVGLRRIRSRRGERQDREHED